MSARLRQKPSYYKRAVLLFDKAPLPWWKFKECKVIPVAFDGRFWIECQMMHGARSHHVVRHGYPQFDEGKEPDTGPGWVGKMMRNEEFIVKDVRIAPGRNYLTVLSYWPVLAVLAAMFVLWHLSGLLFLGAIGPVFLWLRLVVRGGVGNVPVAKDMLGIHRPFILTPYGLEQHVKTKAEAEVDEQSMQGMTA